MNLLLSLSADAVVRALESLSLWLTDLALQSSLLLAAGWLGLLCFRQPAQRMTVAWGTLTGLAALTLLLCLPQWPRLHQGIEPVRERGGMPLSSDRSRPLKDSVMADSSGVRDSQTARVAPVDDVRNATQPPPTSTAIHSPAVFSMSEFLRSLRWAVLFGGAWLLCAALCGVWIVVGALRLRRALRRTQPAAPWIEEELLRFIGDEVPPRLRISFEMPVAAAVGSRRPTILLSAAHATEEHRTGVIAALRHEWAHIRHGDLSLLTIERCLLPVFCLHPLFWLIRRQVRFDQELLADATAAGDQPVEYVTALLAWARFVQQRKISSTLTGLALWEHPRTFSRRVAMLLEPATPIRLQMSRLGRWGVWGSLTAIAVVASLISLRPSPSRAEPPVEGNDQAAKSQPASEAPKAKSAAATGTNQPKPAVKPALDLVPTHTITVKGRAVTENGYPIAGARIYVAACNFESRRLAETTTDAAGNYEMRQVKLPIKIPQPNERQDASGTFQVFGQAKGFGFAWRPIRSYMPDFKLENGVVDPDVGVDVGDAQLRFHYGDHPIVLDLRFPKSASLKGKIVDEQGQPIRGVKLAMRICERINLENFEEGAFRGGDFAALNQPDDVPAEMKIRRTDAAGSFELLDMPPDCLFRFDVDHPEYASQSLYAATTDEKLPSFGRTTVRTGEIKLTFFKVREVPVQVLYGDTLQPAPKVFVNAGSRGYSVSVWKSSDEQGRVKLRLPPGEYSFDLSPQTGTPYLPTEPREKLLVKAGEPVKPVTVHLDRACTLKVTILDNRTGAGVPDVDLWFSPGDQPAVRGNRREVAWHSWEVANRLSRYNQPKSDKQGNLQANIKPGKYHFGPGYNLQPSGYSLGESTAEAVNCVAGETISLTFRLRPEADPILRQPPR